MCSGSDVIFFGRRIISDKQTISFGKACHGYGRVVAKIHVAADVCAAATCVFCRGSGYIDRQVISSDLTSPS